MSIFERTTKRCIDLIVALVALVMLTPLLILIAIAIRLFSPGKILFRQPRLTRGSRPFTFYKFRTMIENAPDIRNADGSTFNAEKDPRVTAVGRILRQTSLDELPQLLNIISGTMTLVGPRPDLADQSQYYREDEWRKNLVKPGITGLAQINGRNSISWAARKQLDLEYVEKQSLRLDLRILFLTFPYVFKRRDVFIAQTSERIS